MESAEQSPSSVIPAISASLVWNDEDLFSEILKRLPVKILCRFRCVCKYWKSLISSASFISLHYSTTSSAMPASLKPYLRLRRAVAYRDPCGAYALCRPQEEHIRHHLHFPFRFRYTANRFHTFNFVDFIRGVICISYSLNSYESDYPYMILWNPAIHKYLPLPSQDFAASEILELDDKCTAHSYDYAIGFGYDSSKDDFKAVRIWIPFYPCHGCECKSLLPICDVYSAREGVWRVSIAEDINKFQIYKIQGCFVNGAVHWVVANHGFSKYFVLMFDFEREEFSSVELPPGEHQIDWFERKELLEYSGMLSLLAKRDDCVGQWVMEEHGVATSWKKLYEISGDTELNWTIDISQYSYQKLAPYGPNECINFRWNEELFDDILSNSVYEESMLLLNYTNAISYTKEGIVRIDTSDPYQRVISPVLFLKRVSGGQRYH